MRSRRLIVKKRQHSTVILRAAPDLGTLWEGAGANRLKTIVNEQRGAAGAPSSQPAIKERRRASDIVLRPKARTVSLRTRLIVLAAMAMALLVAERILTIVNMHADNLAAVETHVLELTDQGIAQYSNTLAAVRAVLTTLAADTEATPTPANGCERLDRIVDATATVESLSFVGTDGEVICSTSAGAVGLDVSSRDYFQIAMRGIGSLSSVSRSYVTDVPTIYAAQPVLGEEGTIIAVLLARVGLEEVFPRHVITALDLSAQVMMVDPSGVVIMSYPEGVDTVGRDLRQTPLVSLALSRTRGTIQTDGPDGLARIYGFMRLPESNMHLIVGVDEESVTAPVKRATLRAAATLFIASCIIFFGLWIAGEKLIVNPVQTLAARLSRFGRGETDDAGGASPVITELQPLVAAFEAMAGELTRRETALRSANRRLNSLASLDPLTGIANRRSFDAVLALQWSTVPSIAMLMIDIDRFKLFNDQYGHQEGDNCIRQVAQALASTVRGTDVVARIGGEEFAVLMPGAELGVAIEVANRLRRAIEELRIPHYGMEGGFVAVSIGCAACRPGPELTTADLSVAADRALYAAKEAGRDTVRWTENVEAGMGASGGARLRTRTGVAEG